MRTMVEGLQKRLHDANNQIASLEGELARTKVEIAEACDATVLAQREAAEATANTITQREGAAAQILELQEAITELKNIHAS